MRCQAPCPGQRRLAGPASLLMSLLSGSHIPPAQEEGGCCGCSDLSAFGAFCTFIDHVSEWRVIGAHQMYHAVGLLLQLQSR